MKKVALHNLGCKVNSYETEVMQQKLQEKGFQIVDFDDVADVYIVNTCTVTNMADRKSRQMLHRAKQKTPQALVVAAGCYVQTGIETVSQDDSIDLAIGNNHKKDIVEFIEAIVSEVGREKAQLDLYKVPEDIDVAVRAYAVDKMKVAIKTVDKLERLDNMDAVEVETKEHFADIYPENGKDVANVLYNITKESVRNMILDEGIRPDNRKLDEIRPIWCETQMLPRVHGSGLFKRGQTQVLSACTLAPASESQTIDGRGIPRGS